MLCFPSEMAVRPAKCLEVPRASTGFQNNDPKHPRFRDVLGLRSAMADHGRSSARPYPDGPHPDGRRGPASPPPSAGGGAGPTPATPEPEQLPPPEWADPTAGRRRTGSWRVRPTGTQSALPAPPAGAPASSLLYGEAGAPSRETGAWPAAGP